LHLIALASCAAIIIMDCDLIACCGTADVVDFLPTNKSKQ
jgi:hypothetical protein